MIDDNKHYSAALFSNKWSEDCFDYWITVNNLKITT